MATTLLLKNTKTCIYVRVRVYEAHRGFQGLYYTQGTLHTHIHVHVFFFQIQGELLHEASTVFIKFLLYRVLQTPMAFERLSKIPIERGL